MRSRHNGCAKDIELCQPQPFERRDLRGVAAQKPDISRWPKGALLQKCQGSLGGISEKMHRGRSDQNTFSSSLRQQKPSRKMQNCLVLNRVILHLFGGDEKPERSKVPAKEPLSVLLVAKQRFTIRCLKCKSQT